MAILVSFLNTCQYQKTLLLTTINWDKNYKVYLQSFYISFRFLQIELHCNYNYIYFICTVAALEMKYNVLNKIILISDDVKACSPIHEELA